jgi:hypothetical protein
MIATLATKINFFKKKHCLLKLGLVKFWGCNVDLATFETLNLCLVPNCCRKSFFIIGFCSITFCHQIIQDLRELNWTFFLFFSKPKMHCQVYMTISMVNRHQGFFFSFQFCEVRWTGDWLSTKRNEPNLATSQRSEESTIDFRILLCFDLLPKYGNFRIFFPQNVVTLEHSHFFPQKILCTLFTGFLFLSPWV